MSQENVETVRAFYDEFNLAGTTGNFRSYVRKVFDADCSYKPVEEEETIRGRDALVRWNERWFEAWDEFRAELDDVIPAGDAVVAAITVRGHGGRSGMSISERFFHVFELRHGKVLRMREYLERQEALDAVGLSE